MVGPSYSRAPDVRSVSHNTVAFCFSITQAQNCVPNALDTTDDAVED
jgi:hypothetical protein